MNEELFIILKKDVESMFGYWWDLRPKTTKKAAEGAWGSYINQVCVEIDGQWYGANKGPTGYAFTKRGATAIARRAREKYYTEPRKDLYEVYR